MIANTESTRGEKATATPCPLEIQRHFTGKSLLVTGASGFVGKLWLAYLLENLPEIGTIHLLLRAKKGLSATDRWREIVSCSPVFRSLRRRHGAQSLAWLEQRVVVHEATLHQEHFGLDKDTYDTLTAQVDLTLGFAGLTDFEPDPRSALQVNIEAALQVAQFAARTKQGRLLHISTAFVRGNVSGAVDERCHPGMSPNRSAFDPRQELQQLRQLCTHRTRRGRIAAVRTRAAALGWPNIYTYSKALAEHLLCGLPGLRLAIIRPAIVEGASRFPFPGWNEGINTSAPIIWLLSSAFSRFPSNPTHRFDVIPVDTVARGIVLVAAASLAECTQGVFHMGSSDSNPFNYRRAVDLTALSARKRYQRPEATAFERGVLRHLDAYPTANQPLPLNITTQRRWLQRWSRMLAALQRSLPTRGLSAIHTQIQLWQERGHQGQRHLDRIEEMLRLYKPFIHDHDYCFRCDGVRALNARLSAQEHALFSFDPEHIDWRHYWLQAQVPGLERWSLPLLYGERVLLDPPQWPLSRSTVGHGKAPNHQPSAERQVQSRNGAEAPPKSRQSQAGTKRIEQRHAHVIAKHKRKDPAVERHPDQCQSTGDIRGVA